MRRIRSGAQRADSSPDAPTSTKVDGLNCAAELDQASALAQSLAAEFPEVLRGDELLDSARGAGVFGRNTHLRAARGWRINSLRTRLRRGQKSSGRSGDVAGRISGWRGELQRMHS